MKRFLAIAIAITVVIGAGIWIMRRQAVEGRYAKRQYQYGIPVISGVTEKKAAGRRNEFIARAKLGRELYRPWAEKNKDVLLKMRSLKNDQEGLNYVYSKLPASPKEAGIPNDGRVSSIQTSIYDSQDKSKYLFSWQISRNSNVSQAGSGETKEGLASYHDVPLSIGSGGAGDSDVVLWASGRITERKFVVNPVKTQGSPAYVEKHTEIAPMFF